MLARVAGMAGFPEAGNLISTLKICPIPIGEEWETFQREKMLGVEGQRLVDWGVLMIDVH